MNSFNRLSLSYIDLFIKEILYDYNKMRRILHLKENAYICNAIKKEKIMETNKIEQSLFTQNQTMDTIVQLKELDKGFLAEFLKEYKQRKASNMETKVKENNEKMDNVKLFITFEIELVNEKTGQVVTLTTTVGSYKELGKYLTYYGKNQWRTLKVTRKDN